MTRNKNRPTSDAELGLRASQAGWGVTVRFILIELCRSQAVRITTAVTSPVAIAFWTFVR
jgi:hypothetical protein